MKPSPETLRKTAYIAFVKRAVPAHTQLTLEQSSVRCRMYYLTRGKMPSGTRRIMVIFRNRLKLGFHIDPSGKVYILHYRSGEWETAVDKAYKLAVNIFGEPLEPWRTTFSKADRSIKASGSRKFLNIFLWPLGLHASTTERELRIIWWPTQWQYFFWAVSVIGLLSMFIDDYFEQTSVTVAVGLIATFLGLLAKSLKKYRVHQSSNYVETLENIKNNVQNLAQIINRSSDKTISLAKAQEVLTLSTREWQELQHVGSAQEINFALRLCYERVLFWAKIWAALSLAPPEERGLILFDEILIHPARHHYLSEIMNDRKKPTTTQLVDPTTWVVPLVHLAGIISQDIDNTLKA